MLTRYMGPVMPSESVGCLYKRVLSIVLLRGNIKEAIFVNEREYKGVSNIWSVYCHQSMLGADKHVVIICLVQGKDQGTNILLVCVL